MSKIPYNELRQVHLDFHTPGFVKVGEKFNAVELCDTLEASEVNAVCFFATCHHGYSYFNTKTGVRHPGLGFDMFGRAADEAAKRTMDFIGYFSLNVNEVVAERHPEWVALFKDGRPVDTQILQDGSELFWRWLCPNRGPFLEEFFWPHIEECLAAYPMEGIFIDMAGYLPGSCFCPGCLRQMRELGIDPDDETARTIFNGRTMEKFAVELRRRMDAVRPGLRLEIGCFNAFGQVMKARGVISDFYVESLAFQAGWFNCPVMARYVSHAGLPVVGYTGRFLKNWGDFGTVVSLPQMKTQLGIQLTSGIACGVGDHMHCSGQVEPAVYDVIREGFRFAKARQPYCTGIERTREVAICAPLGVESNTAMAGNASAALDVWSTIYSAAKLCMEGHFQWDVIDPDMDLDGLDCVIQCHARVDEAWLEKISGFVERGGTLLLDAAGILPTGPLAARWLEFLGLTEAQWSDHPGSYYRVQDPALAAGVPQMANYVHAPSVAVSLAPGASELAQTLYPPCARSREAFYGHFHGCDTEPGGAAVIETRRGKGRILAFTQAILTAYLETGYHAHRSLLLNALRRLLPNPVVTTDAPAIMDVVVGSLDGSCVVQAMPFVSDRRHRTSFESITETIPLGPCQFRVRTGRPAKRVWNPVDGRELAFTNTGEGVAFTLPAITEHEVYLIEPEKNPAL
jgi:hypothetical protein